MRIEKTAQKCEKDRKGMGEGEGGRDAQRVAISAPSGLSPAPSILSTPGEKAEGGIRYLNGGMGELHREREIGRGRGRGKGLIKDRRYSTREVKRDRAD